MALAPGITASRRHRYRKFMKTDIFNSSRRSFLGFLFKAPLIPVAVLATRKVSAALAPPLPPVTEIWLAEWQSAPRLPIVKSDDPTERFFLRALSLKQPVSFSYYGGSAPGDIRAVHPVLLFRVDGYRSAYVTAYCQARQEIRTFRLDRVHLLPS